MKPIQILLVEDNEGDILLTTEALLENKLVDKISTANNGKKALDMIFRRNGFESAELPDLILLDINLPLKNGHEVLTQIKTSSDTAHIPVIMLTTSSSDSDVYLSYARHANCYITKPVDVSDFFDVIKSMVKFWLNTVRLPSKAKESKEI